MGRVFFNTRENLDTTSLTNTTTYVMKASDSGKTFLVSGGAQTVTLLPAASLIEGWRCRFITTASPSGDKVIGAGSAIMSGTHVATPTESDNGAGTDGTPVASVTIEAASQAGNWMEVVCDGSAYYFFAAASQDAAFS